MIRKALLAAALVLTPAMALAGPANAAATQSCAWAISTPSHRALLEAFMSGFVSGVIKLGSVKLEDAFGPEDWPGDWAADFCANHPDKDIGDAATAWMIAHTESPTRHP
jgi:hypothetical protein